MKNSDSPAKGIVAKIKYMKPTYTTNQTSEDEDFEDMFSSEEEVQEKKIDKEFKAYQRNKRKKENE